MSDYLVLNNGSGESDKRLVACVDSLGEAKKLSVIDDNKLKLETDQGVWTLARGAFEAPFCLYGFVGVELPSLMGKLALYLDLRIVAALVKAKIRRAFTDPAFKFVPGTEIPLFSVAESRKIIRQEMKGDFGSLEIIASCLTWIDSKGVTVAMENGPYVPFASSESCLLGRLDARLLMLAMLANSWNDERDHDASYEQREHLAGEFLSSRYAHNKALEKYLAEKERAEEDCLPGTDIPKDSIAASFMGATEGRASNASLKYFRNIPDTKEETEKLIGDILESPEKYSEAIGEWAKAVCGDAMTKAHRVAMGEKMPRYAAKPRPTTDEEALTWFDK